MYSFLCLLFLRPFFQNQQKKRAQGVRLVEEPLKLYCPWNDCKILYTDFREFIKHLNTHAQKAEINDDDSKYNSVPVCINFLNLLCVAV